MGKLRVLFYKDDIIFYVYFANVFDYPFASKKNPFLVIFAKVDTLKSRNLSHALEKSSLSCLSVSWRSQNVILIGQSEVYY